MAGTLLETLGFIYISIGKVPDILAYLYVEDSLLSAVTSYKKLQQDESAGNEHKLFTQAMLG